MRFGGELEYLEIPESNHIADGPIIVSSAELIGTMPKPEKILRQCIVGKLVSSYEWKQMNIVLTSAAIFFSRPGEDILRDVIPLAEIVDVKKRHDIPGEDILRAHELEGSITLQGSSKTLRVRRMSSLMRNEQNKALHIIQLRTLEDGYNSGRSYYLKVESEDACSDWVTFLRTEVGRAVMQTKAGPSCFRRFRFHVRRFYHNMVFQSFVALLIFFSFLVNIVQMELLEMDGSPTFSGFEYAFTAVFAAELVINMVAHFIRPFFRVRGPCDVGRTNGERRRQPARPAL